MPLLPVNCKANVTRVSIHTNILLLSTKQYQWRAATAKIIEEKTLTRGKQITALVRCKKILLYSLCFFPEMVGPSTETNQWKKRAELAEIKDGWKKWIPQMQESLQGEIPCWCVLFLNCLLFDVTKIGQSSRILLPIKFVADLIELTTDSYNIYSKSFWVWFFILNCKLFSWFLLICLLTGFLFWWLLNIRFFTVARVKNFSWICFGVLFWLLENAIIHGRLNPLVFEYGHNRSAERTNDSHIDFGESILYSGQEGARMYFGGRNERVWHLDFYINYS